MPFTSRQRLALALMFLTPAFWAVNYLVARRAPGVIEPHLLAMLRWLGAGAIFAAVNWRELHRERHHIRSEGWRFVVLGALGMYICGAWVYIGGRTTTAVNIALIYALSPIFIVLASAWWLRERFDRRQAVGIGLALAGVLHVILRGQWAALADVQFVPGDGWILAASAAWSAYALLLKRWPSVLSPGARLAVISAAGVLVLLPFAAWDVASGIRPALSLEGLGLVLASALLPGCAAYWSYAVIQQELGAARASVIQYLGPLYAAGLGWLVLGEQVHAHHAIGLALVLGGIYLVTQAQAQAAQHATPPTRPTAVGTD
jgi:drug/metabolite transporter (DMT)-like permease